MYLKFQSNFWCVVTFLFKVSSTPLYRIFYVVLRLLLLQLVVVPSLLLLSPRQVGLLLLVVGFYIFACTFILSFPFLGVMLLFIGICLSFTHSVGPSLSKRGLHFFLYKQLRKKFDFYPYHSHYNFFLIHKSLTENVLNKNKF